MSESTKIRSIKLAHHFKKDDVITVEHVEKPYGEYSSPVVKIDMSVQGETKGKIEIPYENLDEIITALHKAEVLNRSIPHVHIHDELNAITEGGQ